MIEGLKNTEYFRIIKTVKTEAEANLLLATGKTLFVLSIPTDFTKRFFRGERPNLLLEVDATDPVATGAAVSAVNILTQSVYNPFLRGKLLLLKNAPPPAGVIIHAKYNPESITQYNIVPGLLGVVLTMSMVMITSLAITRERERGTMENLLATPIRPLEVILGKLLPPIMIGYLQVTIILLASRLLFNVPMIGHYALLFFCVFPFIFANLSIGLMFSSIARNQLQSMQMSFFFFLPSILLSGFIFPFAGMPMWAQWIGTFLPLTHFLRIVRGIVLKGNHLSETLPDLWPILLFTLLVLLIGVKRYKRTLD